MIDLPEIHIFSIDRNISAATGHVIIWMKVVSFLLAILQHELEGYQIAFWISKQNLWSKKICADCELFEVAGGEGETCHVVCVVMS